MHPAGGGLRFGLADVGLGEDGLALEVAGLDNVVVDQGELANAGCGQILDGRAADTAAADEDDMGLADRDLACAADLRKDDVAGEAG